ncbi:RING finger protein 32-like [Dysidea avara]|uniref:RING finger protein 32-like n=1 Tax=Dysidea avara TaxID=196820 RepID=UPI00332736B2
MACKSDKGSKVSALNAVALQDHLMRQLSLEPAKLTARPTVPYRRGSRITNEGTKTGEDGKKVRQRVDCWLNKPQKNQAVSTTVKEREIVLDPKPPPLSLAQRIGLVEAPKGLLTESDWKLIKQKSQSREDSNQPCVICKEDFLLREQVLLSCSHVFHRACIKAFEQFSGKKCCPLCRTEHYQTRVIYTGANLHRIRAATRIQACWKAYVVRKRYRELRKDCVPNEPILRKKFYEQKLSDVTDQLVQQCSSSAESADRLLSSIDDSLNLSRALMSSLDHNLQPLASLNEDGWYKVLNKAIQRNITDCPICLMPLKPSSVPLHHQHVQFTSFILQPTKELTTRTIELLSCAHLFHTPCILSMEEFSNHTITNICPVCRTPYIKQTLQLIAQ